MLCHEGTKKSDYGSSTGHLHGKWDAQAKPPKPAGIWRAPRGMQPKIIRSTVGITTGIALVKYFPWGSHSWSGTKPSSEKFSLLLNTTCFVLLVYTYTRPEFKPFSPKWINYPLYKFI